MRIPRRGGYFRRDTGDRLFCGVPWAVRSAYSCGYALFRVASSPLAPLRALRSPQQIVHRAPQIIGNQHQIPGINFGGGFFSPCAKQALRNPSLFCHTIRGDVPLAHNLQNNIRMFHNVHLSDTTKNCCTPIDYRKILLYTITYSSPVGNPHSYHSLKFHRTAQYPVRADHISGTAQSCTPA